MIIFQSSLPTEHDYALKPRDDPKIFNTAKESSALQPATQFYKNMAVDYSRAQMSMGESHHLYRNMRYVFVRTTVYRCSDIKWMFEIFWRYHILLPAFLWKTKRGFREIKRRVGDVNDSTIRFRSCPSCQSIKRYTQTLLLIRGIRMDAFHGNFFLRSTDLMALPNVSPHHTYAVEMTIEETLVGNLASFQTALLYTADCGERRIRVLTMAIPVTNNLTDVFTGADPYAITAFLAKKGTILL